MNANHTANTRKTSDRDGFRIRSLVLPFYLPTFLWTAGAGAILPVLPLYIRSLGAELSLVGVVMSMFAIGTMIGNVPGSIVIARLGKRRAMIAAVAAEVMLAVAAALVSNPYQLMPILFALGVVYTLFFVARLAYFRELVPADRRGRALSLLGGETRMGSAVGPVLGGFFADAFGFRIAFLLLAAFSLSVVVLSVAYLPQDRPTAASQPGEPRPRTLRVLRELIREHRRVFVTAGFVVLVLKLVREARKVIFPLWGDVIGMSSSAIGLLFGFSHVIELALFYPAGSVMDRFGRKKTALPCLLLFSIGFLALPAAQAASLFVVAAVLVAIGNGIGAGINMTMSTDLAPPVHTVEFLAVWRTITDAGGAAGPVVIGFTSAALGIAAAAPVVGTIGLAGAAVMAFGVGETLKRPAPQA